jgi:hypothetical protein
VCITVRHLSVKLQPFSCNNALTANETHCHFLLFTLKLIKQCDEERVHCLIAFPKFSFSFDLYYTDIVSHSQKQKTKLENLT